MRTYVPPHNSVDMIVVKTDSIAELAPFDKKMFPGYAGCPSRSSMNLATSLRNPKAPCDPVYAPVPDPPRISRIALALFTTSAGKIERTSG